MKNSESFKSHDKHGAELKPGDLVTIEAKIVDATIQNAGSDLVLETLEASPAGDRTIIRIASRQVTSGTATAAPGGAAPKPEPPAPAEPPKAEAVPPGTSNAS